MPLSPSTPSAMPLKRLRRLLFSIACASGLALGSSSAAFAQRELTDIPVPNAAEELESFQMGDGWTAELFAGDDVKLAKPIHMNWDNHGRLWVASSETYPQIVPGQDSNDKIFILEDTDKDGKADRTVVFADGLLIPTGILPGNDGPNVSAYVVNSDKLEYMVDTDGDLVADERQVILSGFGTEDTHHLLHSLRWGHDGWLYMNQSIYIHSHIETPWGVERLNGGGIWRFHPKTKQLEIVARGFVNPWGTHFDRYGQIFATDGAYGEGINYVFPGSVFLTAVGGTRFVTGLNPGSPKHCGLEILSGSHWPDSIRGSMVTNDFRAHRVCRFVVTDDRAGYESVQQQEIIKTTHVAFRPIDAKQGLDGHLYIADWYNPIIQHGEVDFRDPRRDRTHGRIWRLTHKDQKKVDWAPITSDLPAEKLADLMKEDADLPRLFATQAMRLKTDAGQVARTILTNEKTSNLERLQWLWAFEGLERFPERLQNRLLQSDDGRIRAAVYHSMRNQISSEIRKARAAGKTLDATRWAHWTAICKTGVQDEHPRVRLETVRILAEIPTPEAAALACQILDKPMDRFLDFALWQTLRDLKGAWLPDFTKNAKALNGNPAHIAFALRAVQDPAGVQALMDLIHSGKVSKADDLVQLMQLVAELGNAEQQTQLLDIVVGAATSSGLNDSTRERLFTALLDMSKSKKQAIAPSEKASKAISAWASGKDIAVPLRNLALRAIGQWNVVGLRPAVEAALKSEQSDLRLAGLIGLAGFGDDAAKKQILELTQDADANLSASAIEQASEFDLGATSQIIAKRLAAGQGDEDSWKRIVGILLAKKEGANQLAAALESAKIEIAPETGRILRSVIRSSGVEVPKLLEVVENAAKLKGNAWVWSEELRDRWIKEAQAKGDAHRGEIIYRRTELQCVQCHRIGGVGGLVGPDLTTIGAQAPADYLVEALILPAAKVKEGYNAKLIRTVDDEIITGIPVGETETDVTLRGADGKIVTVSKEDIDESKDSRSLMPDGLLDSLSEQEAIDLLRFMIEMGRLDGPMLVKDDGSVRNWKTLKFSQAAHQVFNRNSLDSVTADHKGFVWQDLGSLVSGRVPLAGSDTFVPHAGVDPTTFLVADFNVERAGEVTLDLGENAKQGLLLWINDVPTSIEGSNVKFSAEEGPLKVYLGVKRPHFKDDIQVKIDRAGTTARLVQ